MGTGSLEIEFPIEFLVYGTPVSAQAKSAPSRDEWKERVKAASSDVIPNPHFASDEPLAATLYYFPSEPMPGDVDNIVKFVLDAMTHHIYLNDKQIQRVVVQKFEPGNVFKFSQPSEKLLQALAGERPVLYVRLSNDPFEELT
jgi:hypothetical protein